MSGTPSVMVFIDYQNTHMSGHRSFCGAFEELKDCTIHPVLLSDEIVRVRPPGGVVKGVRVYRGRPDPRREQRLAQVFDRQMSAWQRDQRVIVKKRQLTYPEKWGQPGCIERPREKGVDVSLAVDLVTMAHAGGFDVAVVVSRDTDLIPAIEAAMDLGSIRVESVTWEGASHLRVNTRDGLKHVSHRLGRESWERCIDAAHY